MPNAGQISTFGLGCAGRIDTKVNTLVSIPQKLAMPFLPYKTMRQLQKQTSTDRNLTSTSSSSSSTSLYRKHKTGEVKSTHTNVQVVGVHSGGHQIFIRISSKVCLFLILILFFILIDLSFFLGTTTR